MARLVEKNLFKLTVLFQK